MKRVVVTAVYPGCERFIPKYLGCLEAATGNFTLLVLKDGEVNFPECRFAKTEIVFNGLTPAGIRYEGLRKARELGFETAILTDIDDAFDPEKIGKLADAVEAGLDFAFGDLDLVDESGRIFERDLLARGGCDFASVEIDHILDRNFIGLSHSAVALRRLGELSPPPAEIRAFDWWFFTALVLHGAKGRWVPGAKTRYVQGETVFRPSPHGPPSQQVALTAARLRAGVDVKAAQYAWLDGCVEKLSNLSTRIRERREDLAQLASRLHEPAFVDEYVAEINAVWSRLPLGWWGAIVGPRKLSSVATPPP